jgi:large subunit ribosomal protein L17
MLANMVTSLFDKERIKTTDAKAKEARRQAERLITRAKKGYTAYQEHQSLKEAGKEAEAKQMQAVALAHWRQAGRVVKKQSVLKKLFDVIAPQFLERNGGYTRILHLQHRPGDNARTVLLELVSEEEKEAEEAPKRKRKTKGKKESTQAAKETKEAPAAEATEEAQAEAAAEGDAEETQTEKPAKKKKKKDKKSDS